MPNLVEMPNSLKWIELLLVYCAFCSTTFNLLQASVSYQDLGREVVLSNSRISMRIEKDSATIVSLKNGNQEYMGVVNSRGYFQRNANGVFSVPRNAQFSLVRQFDSLVEVKFRTDDLEVYPFVFETHYVLREDEGGFYNFTVLKYPEGAIHAANLEQLNLTFRLNPDLFTVAQVRDDLWEVMPTIEEYKSGVSVMDATLRLPEDSAYALRTGDPVYTKYNLAASFEELPVYGTCGEGGYGLWQVTPSHEYVNGTPTTIELTVHQTDTTAVCLRTMTGAHFGSGQATFDARDGGWVKVYGPWFVYLNSGESRTAMWEDAKNMAQRHRSLWPYDWMDHEAFPVERVRVAGKLKITSGEGAGNALVFLAQKEDGVTPNWQQQSKDYVFWTHSDPDGSFHIDHVRPGNYSLFALLEGVPGMLQREGISVPGSGGQTLDLGTVFWSPMRYGETLWQIGIPDRDSTEFRQGDDFRHWGLQWDPYVAAFPDGVNYVIGQSHWATDWYFVHPATKIGENSYTPTIWTVNFSVDEVPEGDCYLHFGIAGGRDARLGVYLNDAAEPVHVQTFNRGSGCPRSGSRGYFEEAAVPFPGELLVVGENHLQLIQMKGNRYSNLQWDFLRLVVPGEEPPLSLKVERDDAHQFLLSWPTKARDSYRLFRSQDMSSWQLHGESPFSGTGNPVFSTVERSLLGDSGKHFFVLEEIPFGN